MDWKTLPSLAALRAFDALARHGSLSAAARELNITHAAVAQHLRGLETHFGTALADRDGQGMRLTEKGRMLADALHDGFDAIAAGVARLTEAEAARPVSISLTPAFAEAWMMPRIGRFWRDHPDVEVIFSPTPRVVDLRREAIDLAIRFGSGSWPGTESEPLSVGSFVVVAAPGLTPARSLEELGDLSRYPWLHSRATREQRVWGKAIGVDFDTVESRGMETNGMVLSATRAGLGLSIQARALAEPDIETGQLVVLHEGDPGGLGYFMVRAAGNVPGPGLKTFMAWLRREARAKT